MKTKTCPRCKVEKPWTDYHAKFKDESGEMTYPQTYCKPCAAEKRREWGEQNASHVRKWKRENYEVRKAIDPNYLERKREYSRELLARKRQDAEWRERRNAKERERRKRLRREDPEWVAREREYGNAYKKEWRKRKRNDPEWVAHQRKRDREYQRNRYQTDPEYRQRVLEAQRFYALGPNGRKRKSPEPVKQKTEWLPIGPFREWLEDYLSATRDTDLQLVSNIPDAFYDEVGAALGITRDNAARRVFAWLNENQRIPLVKADAVLTALDSPARLYELWPELAEEQVA